MVMSYDTATNQNVNITLLCGYLGINCITLKTTALAKLIACVALT